MKCERIYKTFNNYN